jgi:molybdopterin synthase catalytic subunit
MRSAIVHQPIDTTALLSEVSAPANGASLLFLGTVRDLNDGRDVTAIEYSAYEEMARRELAAIVEETVSRVNGVTIAVEHRIGSLEIGEVSVAIAVAHAHRGPAYEASRYIIEEVKRRLPIWKREGYSDGSREWVRSGAAT